MDFASLGILSWGLELPPVRSIEEMVKAKGGDPTNYLGYGWPQVCVAGPDDHPDAMCVRALKSALESAKVSAEKLNLVICTSQTHDFLEVTSAQEVMRDINASSSCVGFDLFQGCLTTLTALDIARDWLKVRGGGYAAIVSGEKWAESIDKADRGVESIWGMADGASALLVGLNVSEKARLEYGGACYFTNNQMSGHLRRAFGGTRHPEIPTGELPTKRLVRDAPAEELQRVFFEGYSKVVADFQTTFKVKPDWLVCNQGTPGVVEVLEFLTRTDTENVVRTGDKYGHVGCSDLIIGIDELARQGRLANFGIALACSPSSWGAGLLRPTT